MSKEHKNSLDFPLWRQLMPLSWMFFPTFHCSFKHSIIIFSWEFSRYLRNFMWNQTKHTTKKMYQLDKIKLYWSDFQLLFLSTLQAVLLLQGMFLSDIIDIDDLFTMVILIYFLYSLWKCWLITPGCCRYSTDREIQLFLLMFVDLRCSLLEIFEPCTSEIVLDFKSSFFFKELMLACMDKAKRLTLDMLTLICFQRH